MALEQICACCNQTSTTVIIRKIDQKISENVSQELKSCWNCFRETEDKLAAKLGLSRCSLCDTFQADVEERRVYVDTLEGTEEVVCCSRCEFDRFMSV